MNVFSLGSGMEDRGMASIGDRADRTGEKNITAIITSIYLELMTILIGFIAAAVVRIQFLLKEKMTLKTLFGDMNVFKTSAKQEASKEPEVVKEPDITKEQVAVKEPETGKETESEN